MKDLLVPTIKMKEALAEFMDNFYDEAIAFQLKRDPEFAEQIKEVKRVITPDDETLASSINLMLVAFEDGCCETIEGLRSIGYYEDTKNIGG